jgi:hypothetical protein
VHAPNVDQESARLARLNYVGRRTGRRLSTAADASVSLWTKLRVLLGEMLYISRPLVTAEVDWWMPERVPWKVWILCLSMDLASLQSLEHANSVGNALTRKEVQRRKMRLFLYLLRAPAWDRTTRPLVERVLYLAQRVPFFGNLASGYVWEYLLYWKLYGAEEG